MESSKESSRKSYLNKDQRGAEEERSDWESNTTEQAKQNEDQEIDPETDCEEFHFQSLFFFIFNFF
jgi:hypothetical protein